MPEKATVKTILARISTDYRHMASYIKIIINCNYHPVLKMLPFYHFLNYTHRV